MSKLKPAKEVTLAPVGFFRDTVNVIVSNSKPKSDEQLAEFRASNAKKREAKK